MNLKPVTGRAYFAKGGSYSTLLAVANTMYATPFVTPQFGFTPDQIGVNVTTGGAGTTCDVRLAIYDDVNGRPGNLVLDAGIVTALTSATSFTKTLSAGAQALIPALSPLKTYWLACVFATAGTTMPTVAALDSAVVNQDMVHELGVANVAALPSTVATGAVNGVSASMTYGAFASVAPATTVILNGKCPLVGLRSI